MQFCSSLSVLALVAAIASGIPRPDEYKIPEIPHDSRAQYYVLHDDGTYKYGYDTGSGIYEKALKMGGLVSGTFGFRDASGKNVKVDYTAGGADGFVPNLSVDGVLQTIEVGDSVVPVVKTAAVPDLVVPVFKTAAIPDSVAPVDRDASYSFAYDAGDSSRREEANKDLNVRGEYSFVADDGVRRRVEYIAGSDTGFVANADFLPKAPEVPSVPGITEERIVIPVLKSAISGVPVATDVRPDGSYSFSYDSGDSSRREEADSDLNIRGDYSFVADDGVRRQVNYIAGSGTGFVAEADFLPKAPEVVVAQAIPVVKSAVGYSPVPTDTQRDASYSFSYDTADSSRREESDSDLNVKGHYSFVADDGVQRRVNYIAGSGTGFVAEADFLPKAPEVPSIPGIVIPTDERRVIPVVKSAVIDVPVESDVKPDGSYSFSYDTGDSSRREEADSNLNIRGDYSFVADDGVRRQVNYIAGSDTGFVAEADFLPKAPEVPSVPGIGIHTHERRVIPVVKSVIDTAPVETDVRPDGSYSFSYATKDSSRREEADSNLNIRGDYSFVADDGIRRQVNYIAGSGTGFVAEADFLPKAPEIPTVPGIGIITEERRVIPVVKSSIDGVPVESDVKPDGGYSFSYDTGDSSRREEADSNLNIRGDYSFVADDGIRRQVNYIAGSDTGFVAEADFLPKAPEVPSVPGVVIRTDERRVIPVVKSVIDTAPVETDVRPDGSYSFSYATKDSSRREEADSNLNVRGDYSFVTDDGVRRQVNYIAGSDTGFVAEADFLPKAPEVPSVPGIVIRTDERRVIPVVKSVVTGVDVAKDVRPDGSYRFSYDSGDSSRTEEADSNLNIRGDYSFVADDGVRRQVNYIAGSETGFVADADFLPKAPEVIPLPPLIPTFHEKVPLVKSSVADVPFGITAPGTPVKVYTVADPKSPQILTKMSKTGHSQGVVGNVLLNQYSTSGNKFGYSYTEV